MLVPTAAWLRLKRQTPCSKLVDVHALELLTSSLLRQRLRAKRSCRRGGVSSVRVAEIAAQEARGAAAPTGPTAAFCEPAIPPEFPPPRPKKVFPNIGSLPDHSLARNAIIFEPRTDIERIIFMATPHQGSTVAMGNVAALGMGLIDLPTWIISELESLSIDTEQLPTSIHGLSPDSQFLQALHAYRPGVPVHSIVGDRGRNDKSKSSDGVVSYSSSHLDFAESELVIPAGHGGFTHPAAIAEIARILKSTRQKD